MGLAVHLMAEGAEGWMAASQPLYITGSVLLGLCAAGVVIYIAITRVLGVFSFSRLRAAA